MEKVMDDMAAGSGGFKGGGVGDRPPSPHWLIF